MNHRATVLGRGSEGAWTSVATRNMKERKGNKKKKKPETNLGKDPPIGEVKRSTTFGILIRWSGKIREATRVQVSPVFLLDFQVQRSVTSLMTLLSTQYKTPTDPTAHPCRSDPFNVKPYPPHPSPKQVILSEPTAHHNKPPQSPPPPPPSSPSFTCTHCFISVREISIMDFHSPLLVPRLPLHRRFSIFTIKRKFRHERPSNKIDTSRIKKIEINDLEMMGDFNFGKRYGERRRWIRLRKLKMISEVKLRYFGQFTCS